MAVEPLHMTGLGSEGSEKLQLLFSEGKRLRDLVDPTSKVSVERVCDYRT